MALEADRVLIEQLHERLDNQPVMAIAAIEVLMGVIERSSAAQGLGPNVDCLRDLPERRPTTRNLKFLQKKNNLALPVYVTRTPTFPRSTFEIGRSRADKKCSVCRVDHDWLGDAFPW